MPPFLSTCQSGSIVTRKNWKWHVINPASSYRQLQNCDQIRCLGCIAGVKAPSIHRPSDAKKDLRILRRSLHSSDAVQTRRFLGCGDGEEGGALSKVYEERRVLRYSAVQLFDVVAAVDLYQDFVPWCQRSEILKSYPDGSFDAKLEIGFKFQAESYVSHVELKRPQYIKTTVSQGTPFDHLIIFGNSTQDQFQDLATFTFCWISSFSHHFTNKSPPCFSGK